MCSTASDGCAGDEVQWSEGSGAAARAAAAQALRFLLQLLVNHEVQCREWPKCKYGGAVTLWKETIRPSITLQFSSEASEMSVVPYLVNSPDARGGQRVAECAGR